MKKLLVIAAAALSALSAFSAQAADFSFSGQLVYNTDVVLLDFTLAQAGDVTLWTDSWQSGLNFDPVLGLFSGGALLQVIDDNDGTIANAGYYDSGALLSNLAAGSYRLTLGAAANEAVGPTLADGFALDGSTPIKLVDWNQPSYDINANDQKGGIWQLHLTGVEQAAVVPEPAHWALLLGGLLVLGARFRARQPRA